jgi:hypothetical protein
MVEQCSMRILLPFLIISLTLDILLLNTLKFKTRKNYAQVIWRVPVSPHKRACKPPRFFRLTTVSGISHNLKPHFVSGVRLAELLI